MHLSSIRLSLRKFTYLAGLAGIGVILLAACASATTFVEPSGSPYSMLNRDISALGEPALTKRAPLFNWGLMVGGALLVGFVVGLALSIRHPAMVLVACAGVFMALGVVMAGLFPVTRPSHHQFAALTTFAGGLCTFALFTATVLVVGQDKLAKWLALPSFVAMMAFCLFLVLPYSLYGNPYTVFFAGPPGPERPRLWLPSLLEWTILLAVVAWVLIMSSYLYRQEQAERPVYEPEHAEQHHL
jgi:hypothetical membrane protein